MKVISQFFLVAMLSIVHPFVFAHGDHEHPPIAPKEAEQAALRAVQHFTTQDMGLGFGKLNKSWGQLSFDAAKVDREEAGYFIVGVSNASEAKTLYVLISDEGDIYDANFSGTFPKLK